MLAGVVERALHTVGMVIAVIRPIIKSFSPRHVKNDHDVSTTSYLSQILQKQKSHFNMLDEFRLEDLLQVALPVRLTGSSFQVMKSSALVQIVTHVIR